MSAPLSIAALAVPVGSDRIVHIEFDRMRGHLKPEHFGHLQVDEGVDLIVVENAAGLQELAVAVEILELGHPDWLEPLGGTIHDGAFHYIASGQWNRYGEGGVARTDLPPLPTVIRRVELPPRGD